MRTKAVKGAGLLVATLGACALALGAATGARERDADKIAGAADERAAGRGSSLDGWDAPAAARPLLFGVGTVCLALGGLALAGRPRRTDAPRTPIPVVAFEPPRGAERFGPYLLLERIGEGGLAEIFSAVRLSPGVGPDRLVVKRLRPELESDPRARAQLESEAAIGAALGHPNVAQVFDHGIEAGRPYLAQEHILGRDLGRLTRRMVERKEPPLSVAAIAHVARELLRALEHVHESRDDAGLPLQIVHRDVTPENVIITPEGEIKLVDFGIAKRRQGTVAQVDVGEVKGNVDFMAPEQARGEAVDHRADLFSVGMLVYFAAARGPLYRAKSVEARVVKAATGPAERERAFVAGLAPPLPELVARALAIDPAARFDSAAEMRAALGAELEGGAAELGDAVRRLFGAELEAERARFAAVPCPIRVPAGVGRVVGRGRGARARRKDVPARSH